MSEFIEAKKLDGFKNEIVSEFLSLCCYNDWCDLPLFRIVETIDEIYDKYYSKPLADVESKREWIPVTERLPEDNTRVLGFSEPDKDIYCYDVDGVKWWTEDYWNTAEGYGITHWMPLPEPPETEKGGE
jgi:hypothetical protein